MRGAVIITFIPKQDSDLTQVKNYRPISLLNNDYKLFASILAKRMKKLLQEVIHKDQAGFLPGRQMKDNIRNIINILEYLTARNEKQAMLIFVGAEKAFDNISWEFMLKKLEAMHVRQEFFNGIKAIYTEQRAKLFVNNVTTEDIKITKGTRQGCPLSPLFILVLEIFLRSIRKNKLIRGVTVAHNEYKVKAFADDLVLAVEELSRSVKEVLEEIEQFGQVAGFILNKKKTKIIAKNMEQGLIETMQQQIGIEVVKKVKYLGIWLTPKNIDLFQNNYTPMWNGIKRDLEVWGRMKLSFWGRISTIKMSMLPKMLFLFQTIPIIKGAVIFKEWQRTISRYTWQGKKPRIQFANRCERKRTWVPAESITDEYLVEEFHSLFPDKPKPLARFWEEEFGPTDDEGFSCLCLCGFSCLRRGGSGGVRGRRIRLGSSTSGKRSERMGGWF
uniref:Reverse transcriptase domain-containing protein n=1 Tax=Podarcis muralis TaxID=64176 RepID=A0A670K2J7_PODMU